MDREITGNDIGIDTELADAPGDQLGRLTAEIQY